jgi:hypothetical protein
VMGREGDLRWNCRIGEGRSPFWGMRRGKEMAGWRIRGGRVPPLFSLCRTARNVGLRTGSFCCFDSAANSADIPHSPSKRRTTDRVQGSRDGGLGGTASMADTKLYKRLREIDRC